MAAMERGKIHGTTEYEREDITSESPLSIAVRN